MREVEICTRIVHILSVYALIVLILFTFDRFLAAGVFSGNWHTPRARIQIRESLSHHLFEWLLDDFLRELFLAEASLHPILVVGAHRSGWLLVSTILGLA